MDWIIESQDEITRRIGVKRYGTEAGFLAPIGDILRHPRRRLITATSPTGEVLDETAARVLAGIHGPGLHRGTER
jgi:hypothetical protein